MHIGFKLFDRSLMGDNNDALFFYFIERYLLELMLLEENDIQVKLKHQRVKIKSEIYPLDLSVKDCLTDVLSNADLVTSVQVSRNKNRYTVVCYKDDKIWLALNFPASRELITAYTKLEAEQALFGNFERFLSSPQEDISLTDVEMLPYKDKLFYAFDGSYLNEEMISTSFYKKDRGVFKPVFDVDYPVESSYNLFNAYYNDSSIISKLTFSLYAGESHSYELPLCLLASFLRNEGCQFYTGIKKLGRSMVESSVMAVNHDLGYYHLLVVSSDRQIWERPADYKVNVKMYCYIPMHNVSNLMGK